MKEGLSFAEIARRLKISPSRVEENVKRIYRAIHRKLYTARRRRIDAPAEGIALYCCPKYAQDCPPGCHFMKNWLESANRC